MIEERLRFGIVARSRDGKEEIAILPATCSSEINRLTLFELHCAFLKNDSDCLMIVNAQP
jgi:hypothetical protein